MLDYHSEKPFQVRIGSFPYMPPELDLALPVELDFLPKSDIYSYGLVMTAIFINGTTPFQGLTANEVTELKLAKKTETEASAWPTVVAECGMLNSCGSSTTSVSEGTTYLQTLQPTYHSEDENELLQGYHSLPVMYTPQRSSHG